MKLFVYQATNNPVKIIGQRKRSLVALILVSIVYIQTSSCYAGLQLEQAEVVAEKGSDASSDLQQEQESSTISALELLPARKSLFGRDSIDLDQITRIDCHLRNVDFCYAGMLGASSHMLPETDPELEARCDEMRVTASCLAVYNQRCSSFKAFGAISPLLVFDQFRKQLPEQVSSVAEMEIPLDFEPPQEKTSLDQEGDQALSFNSVPKVKLIDFLNICEPEAKNQANIIKIRKRLFGLAKCLNARIPRLAPCLDDLKVSLQLLYEPSRMLPLRPSCCAISRFRHCATQALDNVCGLSSFEQLVEAISNANPTGSSLKLVERICRNATDFESEFCQEMLPPPGTKIPPRRGNKASKLAKALDLFSFSPATSASGAQFQI